jgi:hypothetical protein
MASSLTLTTPGLLFPTISLLMLAYTTRSLALASLVRELYERYLSERDPKLLAQIKRLKRQVRLIRNMQVFAILGGLLCIVCMLLVYFESGPAASWVFTASMIVIAVSFAISLKETTLLGSALVLQLEDMESHNQEN